MNEIEELKKDLDLIIAKATEYDKLDHKFKSVCGKRVEQVLQHLCLFGFGDGITEQQALNKLAERFPMTTDQIVSTLEMSQIGVYREPVEVLPCVAEFYEMNKDDLDFAIYKANVDIHKCDEPQNNPLLDWLGRSSNKPIETLFRMKTDGYTVAKEPLYFWRLNLQSTILYQFAIRRGSSYTLKSGFPIAECAMTEKTAKEILRKDFSLFKPIEPKLNDGTIVDAVPVEEEE